MFPEGFEPLSFEDNVLVARINLCCAAIVLLVFAFLLESWDWPGRTLALVATAGFIYLARQIEWVFRGMDRPRQDKQHSPKPHSPATETFLSPF